MNNSREKVNMKYVSSLGLRNLFQQRMFFFSTPPVHTGE